MQHQAVLAPVVVSAEPAGKPLQLTPVVYKTARAKPKSRAPAKVLKTSSASTGHRSSPVAEKAPDQPSDPSDRVIEKAKIKVAQKMKDASSAVFDDLNRAERKNALGDSVDSICGHVRAKKASGEDTEAKPFLYLVKEDEAYVVDSESASVAATAYRTMCTGQ
jgi:hypothetical protein